jgi:hypothetical protein
MYKEFFYLLIATVCNLQPDVCISKYSSPFILVLSFRVAARHSAKDVFCLFHSEHSYGTTRDSDEEDAEPEDGERLDHPYSAPQVCSYMFCLTYCNEKEMFFKVYGLP